MMFMIVTMIMMMCCLPILLGFAATQITSSPLINKVECGPMPNVMAALPNTGGALCSTPQCLADVKPYSLHFTWLTPTTRVLCSNAAKTQNPLKFAGVPQTPEPISAVSLPCGGDMWRTYCCLTIFFQLSIHTLVTKL